MPEVPLVPLPRAEQPDPHLWLEEVLGEAALETVKGWNAHTLTTLESDARFEPMQAAAMEILTSDARLATGPIRGEYLYNFWQDPTHVRGIWRRSPLDAYVAGTPEWEVLFDLDAVAAEEGENWIWAGAHCAPGSSRCLLSLSRGGKDARVVREFSLTDKAFVPHGFELPEAKSRVTMVDENTVLVATDMGEGSLTTSGYPRHMLEWKRGESLPAASEALLSADPTDMGVYSFVAHHSKRAYRLLQHNVTFYETRTVYLPEDGEPIQLPIPREVWLSGVFRGALVMVINEPWTTGGQTWPTGSLMSYDLGSGEVQQIFAPEEGTAIEGVVITKKSVVVQVVNDVIGEVRRFRPKGAGWQSTTIDLPPNGQVSIVSESDERDDFLVTYESLTQPVTLFHVDKKNGVREVSRLPSFYEVEDVVVEQRFATSKDGTRVPYFLMAKKSVLDAGPAPTIQYGYGGFLASVLPTYFRDGARPQQGAFAGKMWVASGGVMVLSNIRGGSEYGPEWHQAALKANRQRAYEDFFAIGEALVADGVTTPGQLGAIGRSNGGLLMGVVLTQRPDLYRAIDIGVPLLDMLRYHTLLAGASWMGEYGDPDVPEEREFLKVYSPYQNLDSEADYPKVLFYTSTRDDRVHPGHARKMAAALESMGRDFYYWENIEGGHGGVANQEQAALRIAIEFLYFKRELGLE